jgi:predicted outer membrane repeat protein
VKGSKITVYNTSFSRNFAIYGGVLYLGLNGDAEFYNCTFENNTAITGGVVYGINFDKIEFNLFLI